MIPVRLVEGLAGAAAADLAEIEISPAGLGPALPAARRQRLRARAHAGGLRLEALDGSARGAAGGRASNRPRSLRRRNGRRGGRPRKEVQ